MTAELKKDGMLELQLKREFPFPRDLVFDAWVKPEHLSKWMGPTEDITLEDATVDLREGGSYSMTFQEPDCDNKTVSGIYKTIKRPEKLVFTWAWELPSGETDVETLVTVDFAETQTGTLLTLTHQKFVSKDVRDHHSMGWSGSLDKLEQYTAKLAG